MAKLLWAFLAFAVAAHIHEPGYCAMYGLCGLETPFGADLPCLDNRRAVPASSTLLREVCPNLPSENGVCCSESQLTTLKSNLDKVKALISACPACHTNFVDFFCHFTCSANQSMFVNVTSDGPRVAELDYFVNTTFAERFFDSCKEVKLGMMSGYAMDLIGGGAKTPAAFLKFLGDKKPMLGGSPFQINFPQTSPPAMTPLSLTARDCDDAAYKCSCGDCAAVCPTLPELAPPKQCKVGPVPCFSFLVLLGVSVAVSVVIYLVVMEKMDLRFAFKPTSEDLQPLNDFSKPQKSNRLNVWLEDRLAGLAYLCASSPKRTIFSSLLLAVALSLGMLKTQLVTDPTNLWVSPDAEAFQQKQYFDEKFGPFYKTEQVFVSSLDGLEVLSWETLRWWATKEQEIATLQSSGSNYTLADICFKPLDGGGCVIESWTQYFGSVEELGPDTWRGKLSECASQPVTCLPSFGQPLKKELLFGGYGANVLDAKAFVVTYVVNNGLVGSEQVQRAQEFEFTLEKYLLNLQLEGLARGLKISFSTDISLEKELNSNTKTDFKIIVVSYILMFLYASVALSLSRGSRRVTFSLGLVGIVVVLLSVTASAGLCALAGVKSTLIIAEVIPFLVLAIGIDNIFLLSHELSLIGVSHPSMSVPERVALCVRRLGPGIFLSAMVQFGAFSLASTVAMPAVRNFAIYSAGAIFINVLMQITGFVAYLAVDEARRAGDDVVDGGFFSESFIKHYSPFILSDSVRKVALVVFLLWFTISFSLLPGIELGLDQRIAIPQGSYLIDYFDDMYSYLNVGAPIYFVVKGLNFTERSVQQKLCGRYASCDEFSLANVLEQERERSDVSLIVEPVSNWIDDYFSYLNPDLDQCCRVSKRNSDVFCKPFQPSRSCDSCMANREPAWDTSMDGFPEGEEFMRYFNHWIEAPSDDRCPLGGKAPYSSAIAVAEDGKSIDASTFRTSHSPLRSQADFIAGYQSSLRVVLELQHYLGIPSGDVFAYSPFYIFFVQYQNIVKLTVVLLSTAVAFIFGVSRAVLGVNRASLIIVLNVVMILTDIGGVMAVWGISLNAVSLV
ncbi:hypothetical protein BABINDRAFT_162017, partial [Babjeviella inositovora NRRL Y-12698]